MATEPDLTSLSSEPLLDGLSRALNTPLLKLGDVALTPMFLVKVAVFIAVLLAVSALVRRRLVLKLLTRANVDEGTKYATARISGYVVWVVGLLIGLPMLGVKLSSLAVAFGAVGIGIGLGLQKIAENFISGLILLFGRPVKVGDRIEVGDDVGTVEEIQARVTLVRTNDNTMILVPNSELISDRVINLTHNDRLVRFSFPIGVSYEADPEQVRTCLLEVAAKHTGLLEDPAPDVLFVGFGDSSLDFQLRAYTREMVTIPEVLVSEVNFAIWYRLKEAGISIPFPQRDLHIKSVPDQAMKISRLPEAS